MSNNSSTMIQGIPDWKIALFAGVTMIATVFFYSQSTDGFNEDKLSQAVCSEKEARPDLLVSPTPNKKGGKESDLPNKDDSRMERGDTHAVMTLLSCRNGEDRRRLAVGYLIEKKGEMFEQVALIRDRLRDLTRHNKETSDWALNNHLAFMWVIFVGLAFAAIFKTNAKAPSPDEADETLHPSSGRIQLILSKLKEVSVTATLIVGILIAAAQSLSFHTKYEAAFIAQRSFRTLAVEVDAEFVNIVRRAEASSKFKVDGKDVEVMEYLGARIIVWMTEIRAIEQSFAKSYADIEPITPPGS